MRATEFTVEQDSPTDGASAEPEYSFEGFDVDSSEKVMLTPVGPPSIVAAKMQSVSRPFSVDPDREGTFIVPDIYPGDFKGDPPFHLLPGLTVDGKEVVGCVVKASQGTGWGRQNEDWFKRSWKAVLQASGSRYGVDFFRGCYHYLQFSVDGAKQADYFCDLVDAAGGWGAGDLMPWVDIEEADQGSWASQKLEKIADASLRKRLAGEVSACATAFIQRLKARTGLRVAVYGRGVFRDLQMTSCKFGSDSAVNPAYTASLPPMDKYGVSLDDISLWQLSGDTGPVLAGYPNALPGWGTHDYSVYIDGPRKTSLKTLRTRCLAKM
jgi:GH25 family lysozyme M1 (1,4-beta-N-acetylmuramidase)